MVNYIVKENRIVFVSFIISVFVSIIFTLLLALNICKHSEWLELFLGIAISIIAAFIFYIFQIAIPTVSERRAVYPNICNRLFDIIGEIDQVFYQMSIKYLDDNKKDSYTSDDLHTMLNVKLDDFTQISDIRSFLLTDSKQITFRELIRDNIFSIERKIDSLYLHYSKYIAIDIANTLDKILYSNFHGIMKKFVLSDLPTDFSTSNTEFIADYWHLRNELNSHIIHLNDKSNNTK